MYSSIQNEQNISKVNGSQVCKFNDIEEIISAINDGLDIENVLMEIKTYDNKSMTFKISFDNDSPYYRVIGRIEGEEDRVSSICGSYGGADIDELIEAVKEIMKAPIEEERDTRNVIDRIKGDFAISEEDRNYLNEYEENVGNIAISLRVFESYSTTIETPMVKGTDYNIETELQINTNYNKERNIEIRISSKEYDKEVTETVYDDDVYNELFIKYLMLGMITKLYEEIKDTPANKKKDDAPINIKTCIEKGVELGTFCIDNEFSTIMFSPCGVKIMEYRNNNRLSDDMTVVDEIAFDMSEMTDEKGIRVIEGWIKETFEKMAEKAKKRYYESLNKVKNPFA